jgi:hypothetical protein
MATSRSPRRSPPGSISVIPNAFCRNLFPGEKRRQLVLQHELEVLHMPPHAAHLFCLPSASSTIVDREQ